jgi:hypothetical protein
MLVVLVAVVFYERIFAELGTTLTWLVPAIGLDSRAAERRVRKADGDPGTRQRRHPRPHRSHRSRARNKQQEEPSQDNRANRERAGGEKAPVTSKVASGRFHREVRLALRADGVVQCGPSPRSFVPLCDGERKERDAAADPADPSGGPAGSLG